MSIIECFNQQKKKLFWNTNAKQSYIVWMPYCSVWDISSQTSWTKTTGIWISIKAGKPSSSTYVQVPPEMIRCLVIAVIRRVVLYPSLGQEQLSPTPREERIEDGQVEANPLREETELTLNTWTSKLILLAIRLMWLVCFSYRFFALSKDFYFGSFNLF